MINVSYQFYMIKSVFYMRTRTIKRDLYANRVALLPQRTILTILPSILMELLGDPLKQSTKHYLFNTAASLCLYDHFP